MGGLPEIVDKFVHNIDFTQTADAQRDLIAGYRRDITKYAKKDKALVRAIFDSIPFQLAKQDKRFVLAELEKGGSNRKYADPTQWLLDAGMAYAARSVNSFESKHELDFLLPENDGVHIVEVKSGDNYKSHASLNYAMEHEGERISRATVLCKDNVFTENGITYLPLYMAMFL